MEALSNHSSVSTTVQKSSESDSLAFTGIFVTIFMLFFSIAMLACIFRLPWRSWFPGAEQSSSLTGGIKAAVYTLMSHLK
jgi:light-harvesting complex 1 beta chain